MKRNKRAFAIAFMASVFMVSSSALSEGNIPQIFSPSLNVVTVETSSVMGNEIAKALSQLIYTRGLTVKSSLRIRENIPSRGAQEILLETPLRSLTSHRFAKSRPRTWSNPESVAEHFVFVAQREGILVEIR